MGAAVSIGLLTVPIINHVKNTFKGKRDGRNEEVGKLKSRLPPGQYRVDDLRVLHVGSIPVFNQKTWDFEVFGLVKKPLLLDWSALQKLPQIEIVSDFHCVTGWSKLDIKWGGVGFGTICDMVEPKGEAGYATIICDGGYTTSLPVNDLQENDVLFAYELDGKMLEPKHGGPLRLVVPKKYGYKSAKWVRKVKFMEGQELGYWEVRGYSNTADPWMEDRYSR